MPAPVFGGIWYKVKKAKHRAGQLNFAGYPDAAGTEMTAKNNVNILQFILDVGNVSEAERNEYLDRFITAKLPQPMLF